MLPILEQYDQFGLDGKFSTLQASVLSNESASSGDRIVALSLLGQRKAPNAATSSTNTPRRPWHRVAIAALGQIANPEDKSIIQAVLDDPDSDFLVKKASETAIKNFR